MIVALMLLTFGYAAGYYSLSPNDSPNGLKDPDDTSISFSDAIYFSVITEATLGYGDIRPRGWSRGLACTQVIFGLVLAGIGVAKLTSLSGRQLRLATSKAYGDWIEIGHLSNSRIMISFSTIYLVDSVLRYDGENFHSDGRPWGFFRSELIDVNDSLLRFSYSNRESDTAEFVEGISTVQFIEESLTGHWMRGHANASDFGKKLDFTYESFRASDEESKVFRGADYEARRTLIRKIYDRFKPRKNSSDENTA